MLCHLYGQPALLNAINHTIPYTCMVIKCFHATFKRICCSLPLQLILPVIDMIHNIKFIGVKQIAHPEGEKF